MNYRYQMNTPLGELRLFSCRSQLTGLYFEGHTPAPKFEPTNVDSSPFTDIMDQLEQYFGGERDIFEVEIEFHGTEFQQQVWEKLRSIPLGQTRSYSELAQSIDRPKAVRAVGAAVGRNPISIIVPCHRVLGSDGSMTGFAGGLVRKKWLLSRENAVTPLPS